MAKVKVGDTVEFIGFVGDDLPKGGDLLVEGDTYEVTGVYDDVPEEVLYRLLVTTKGKRGAVKRTEVEVFFDECELVPGEKEAPKETEPEDAPATEEQDEDFVEPADVEVGIEYDVQMKNEDIPVFSGVCTKVTKTLVYIGNDKYKKADIDALFVLEPDKAGEDQVDGEEQSDEEAVAAKKSEPEPPLDSKKASRGKAKDTKDKPGPAKKAAPKKKATTKAEVPAEAVKGSSIAAGVDNEDEDIAALVEDSDDICALAKECLEDSAVTDWRLGGVLHYVLDGKAYEDLSESYRGVKGFERYCIAELGLQYRKARYLINIYVDFRNAGLGANDLVRIGWTKGRHLIKVLNSDNAQEMIELAENNTVESLIDEIKVMEERLSPDKTTTSSSTTKEKGETVKKISFKFHYFQDEADYIAQSLDQVMVDKGVETEAEALYAIITDYMTELHNS